MRITLGQPDIKHLSTSFNRIIARRTTIPVLEHLLFTAAPDGSLHVTGTNLDETLALKLTAPVADAEPGYDRFLVPMNEICRLAKTLRRDDTVDLSTVPGQECLDITVTANGQSTTSRIETLAVDDFPSHEDGQVTSSSVRELSPFINAFRRISTFASSDETRQALNGVFWDADEYALVATDGRRLGMTELTEFGIDQSAIIPRTKFLLKQKFTGETSVDFRLLDRDGPLDFEIAGNGFDYRVRCIDATYPNYKQVIPDSKSNFRGMIAIAEQDLPVLESAVDRLAASDGDRAIIVYADTSRVALVGKDVLTDDGQARDIHVVLPNSSHEPETSDHAVGCVNGQFLLDAVRAGFTDIRVSEGFTPWLSEGKVGTHVVMPLRIDATDKVEAYAERNFGAVEAAPASEESVVPAHETVEPGPADNGKEIPMSKETTPKEATHKPDLKVVEKPDAMDEFNALLISAQEAVKAASSAVRDLKRAGKALERDFKDREKQLVAREKEFEKNAKLINRLQEAIAA